LGNGDGTFEVGLSFAVGDSSRISLGDLDGDGILDLANAGATGVSIVLGNTREGINPLLDFSLKTKAGALQAMAPLDRKLEKLNAQRGVVGSYQSRLGVSLNILDVGRENFKFAESRIRDADIAGESAMLVKNKILQQAAAAVLSQANQGPTLALALLS
jgi:flagellin